MTTIKAPDYILHGMSAYLSPRDRKAHGRLMVKRQRKDARTHIYTAIYGLQTSPGENLPWHDHSRRRPQDFNPNTITTALQTYWSLAKFDDRRKTIILKAAATALNTTLADLAKEFK
jgi:hypothetical protein